jgi:hypothetical protein
MSIDAQVRQIGWDDEGNLCLFLHQPDPYREAGRDRITVEEPVPDNIGALLGRYVWGGSDDLMLGDSRIGVRKGFGGVELCGKAIAQVARSLNKMVLSTGLRPKAKKAQSIATVLSKVPPEFFGKPSIRRTLSTGEAVPAVGAVPASPEEKIPLDLAGLSYQSVVLKAGAKAVPLPPSGRLVYPRLGGEDLILNPPAKTRIYLKDGQEKPDVLLQLISQEIDRGVLGGVGGHHRILEPNFGRTFNADWLKLVRLVEEGNGQCEGFVTRNSHGRSEQMFGYPIYLTNAMPEGDILAGMWSDLILAFGPDVTFKTTSGGRIAEFDFAWAARHPEAFARGVSGK